MSRISRVATLIVVGELIWPVNSHIPVGAKIKTILNIVVRLASTVWLMFRSRGSHSEKK